MTLFIENRNLVLAPARQSRDMWDASPASVSARSASAIVHIQGAFLCLGRSYDVSTALECRRHTKHSKQKSAALHLLGGSFRGARAAASPRFNENRNLAPWEPRVLKGAERFKGTSFSL